MKSILTLLSLWRPRLYYLLFGALLAVLSLGAGFFLTGQSGARLGSALLGTSLAVMVAGFSLLRIAGGLRIILRYIERLVSHDAMFRALSSLRVWFYRKLAYGAAAGLGFQRSADILSRLVADIQMLDGLYLRIFIPFVTACITLPFLLIFSMPLGWGAVGLLGTGFAVIAFFLPWLSYKLARCAGPGLLEARSSLQVSTLELISGLREARIFGAEKRLVEQLFQKQNLLYSCQKKQGIRMILAHTGSMLIGRIMVIVTLIILGGWLGHWGSDIVWLHGSALGQAGEAALVISFVFLVMAVFDSVSDLPRAGFLAGEASHASDRILEIVTPNRDLPFASSRESSPENVQNGKEKPFPSHYDICFQHVAFRWKTRDRQAESILKNVSFSLPEGKHMALIGPSGAGKSSLAALLLKAVSPQQGQIMIGGEDLSALSNASLRKNIAWLSQNSHLFNDTIRNNLLLGRQNIAEERLWFALDQAQIGDFVRQLPHGLDEWIGENGTGLSGGQGRRIALARTLLSEAPILLLDEPAAGLDLATERAFFETLNMAIGQRSLILITHRLTGVENLDYLYRLDDGVIKQEKILQNIV